MFYRTGEPHGLRGDPFNALVVPRPEWRDRLTADDIRDKIAEAVATGALPKYAIPERVSMLDTLDKTSVGKINKRALRERYR